MNHLNSSFHHNDLLDLEMEITFETESISLWQRNSLDIASWLPVIYHHDHLLAYPLF